jgi:ABC-type transport system involved in multi-copper enzyme maturation permease subunit
MTPFRQVLHAEWTKFRTVRGLVIGMLLLPLLTVGFGALTGSSSGCGFAYSGPNGQMISGGCSAPTGPGGELVKDQLYYVHQPIAASATITARVTSLTSSDLQPWAKTGIMVKASTKPGSAYAAMLVTGAHGVRFQWNYTQDTPGLPGKVTATPHDGSGPRWLRLVRDGDTITGYDSADGVRWTKVGSASLTGLPSTAQAGLFATSPASSANQQASASSAQAQAASGATGTFDQVSLTGTVAGTWTGTSVGAGPGPGSTGTFQQTSTGFSVNGNGDVAPDLGDANNGTGTPISQTLDGIFIAMLIAIVIGAMFITTEYRRDLIRVTLAATPARGRVLAAKAIVLGGVTFVAALIGCAISVPLGSHLLRVHGDVVDPVSLLTWLRVVVGTAAVLAAAGVLAVALGTVFRRGAATVSTAIVVVVVPWFLAVSSQALPTAVADWLLRISPSAAVAVQQTIPQYAQVAGSYTPNGGFFPLPPLAGFAVLCAWTACALWLAAHLLRRRDV